MQMSSGLVTAECNLMSRFVALMKFSVEVIKTGILQKGLAPVSVSTGCKLNQGDHTKCAHAFTFFHLGLFKICIFRPSHQCDSTKPFDL